ncbi:hypothetical protein DPMN_064868 [Dreissena polymorpha]|uniref:Uncharacterized protein n=1 Tax=Dreissena polymorpha TaxID=45954 RepID=A0A9D4CEM2_DREPO|nr:hypothetical protein DPMN_064868 [Dreissena polymorpha]
MFPQQITRLLAECLNWTYLCLMVISINRYTWTRYRFSVSPIVCSLYMGHFEEQTLRTAQRPLGWWFGYAEDTHTKQKVEHVEEFT